MTERKTKTESQIHRQSSAQRHNTAYLTVHRAWKAWKRGRGINHLALLVSGRHEKETQKDISRRGEGILNKELSESSNQAEIKRRHCLSSLLGLDSAAMCCDTAKRQRQNALITTGGTLRTYSPRSLHVPTVMLSETRPMSRGLITMSCSFVAMTCEHTSSGKPPDVEDMMPTMLRLNHRDFYPSHKSTSRRVCLSVTAGSLKRGTPDVLLVYTLVVYMGPDQGVWGAKRRGSAPCCRIWHGRFLTLTSKRAKSVRGLRLQLQWI